MTRSWALFLVVALGCHQNVSTEKQCTSRGRFPNDLENDCMGFSFCLSAGAGRFTQYNFNCSTGFVFHHVLGQCSNATNYRCQPSYNCTYEGNFIDPYKDDCRSYIACVEGFTDVMTARSIDCPENEMFSPEEGTCVNGTDVCNSGHFGNSGNSGNSSNSTNSGDPGNSGSYDNSSNSINSGYPSNSDNSVNLGNFSNSGYVNSIASSLVLIYLIIMCLCNEIPTL